MLKKEADIAFAIDGAITKIQADKITLCLCHMNNLKSYIADIESKAMQLARPYSGSLAIIQSVPGVSELSALIILSEIGADMSLFHSAKHLCSWAGLTPSNDQSAGKKNRSASVVLASISNQYSFSALMQPLKIKALSTIALVTRPLSTAVVTREPLSP
jgi:transposase